MKTVVEELRSKRDFIITLSFWVCSLPWGWSGAGGGRHVVVDRFPDSCGHFPAADQMPLLWSPFADEENGLRRLEEIYRLLQLTQNLGLLSWLPSRPGGSL